MYNNIGAKIKILAQIIAWVGIIGSVIIGFISLTFIWGIGVLIGGSLLSWILSWFIYGFGELIQKTSEIAQNTAKGASANSLTAKMETLITWKESNLISEEEFEIKKQALLRGEWNE
ncbi:MAG: hypothetical protein FWH17_04935 [Oscillospiraceae bacterium]|nr:hypothetical protein [Oscillospiraceae bacterium]